VLSVAELVDDPQFNARGAFVEAVHPRHGSFRQVAPTLAGMDRPGAAYAVHEADHTDTDELLRAAGMSSEDSFELRRTGVVA
jgi:crotonobetainyl-CoA:carnitine CoA-transferase CaiB-like acyl-CoA transferase